LRKVKIFFLNPRQVDYNNYSNYNQEARIFIMKSFLGMKEPVNTLTHFIAFLTAIAGLVFLIIVTRNEPAKLLVITHLLLVYHS